MDEYARLEDSHGNINAAEGYDRCVCGCKYWENDRCIDCDTMVEIAQNRMLAEQAKMMCEIRLNVIVTSSTFYKYGWEGFAGTDAVEIVRRYRAAGSII